MLLSAASNACMSGKRFSGRCWRALATIASHCGERPATTFDGGSYPASRKLTRQHLVEHDPRGIDVAAMIDGSRVPLLLGRHVDCRADRLIGHGHVTGRTAGTHRGNAEVGHLSEAVPVDEDIARFDIAVNDPFAVRKTKRLDNLEHQRSHLLAVQAPVGNQTLHVDRRAAVPAFHIFHDVVDVPGSRLAAVENGDDVRMGKANQRRNLAIETSHKARVFEQRRRHHFDGDFPIQRNLSREIDDSHAAFAQAAEDFVSFDLELGNGRDWLGRRSTPRHQRVLVEDGNRCAAMRALNPSRRQAERGSPSIVVRNCHIPGTSHNPPRSDEAVGRALGTYHQPGETQLMSAIAFHPAVRDSRYSPLLPSPISLRSSILP